MREGTERRAAGVPVAVSSEDGGADEEQKRRTGTAGAEARVDGCRGSYSAGVLRFSVHRVGCLSACGGLPSPWLATSGNLRGACHLTGASSGVAVWEGCVSARRDCRRTRPALGAPVCVEWEARVHLRARR